MNKMKPAKSVDAYFSSLAQDSRAALLKLRSVIRSVVPKASEKISYGMPAFYYLGHPLVSFAAFKDHLSFFPMSVKAAKLFSKELKPYLKGVSTLQFTEKNPLPASLIRNIVKARIKEVEVKE